VFLLFYHKYIGQVFLDKNKLALYVASAEFEAKEEGKFLIYRLKQSNNCV